MIGHRQALIGMSEVENPLYSRDHPESLGNPQYVAAFVNTGIDEVAFLYKRNAITLAQKLAGDRFGEEYRAMYCVGGSAFGEFVDTGRRAKQFGHRQAEAWSELQRCRQVLEKDGYYLVMRICGEGYRLRDLYPVPSLERTFWKEHLKRDLTKLAGMWGMG